MFRILYKYFAINRRVSLPGIGVFYIHRQPATLDFSKKAFISPVSQIGFTTATAVIDKKLCSYIAGERQTDGEEALRLFENFTQDLKEDLNSTGRVELPGLGLLFKNVEGALQFEPVMQLPSFFTDASVERMISNITKEDRPVIDIKIKDERLPEVAIEEAQEPAGKKSYWWVSAIIIGAAAIAAIVYYYIQNGSLR